MPLSERSEDALRVAAVDAATRSRFTAKIVVVPGSGCHWWTGSVSGKGHGRFWLTETEAGRDVGIVAHRFGFALAFGVDALLAAPLLGHRCDNPLCQRIGEGHVVASSPTRNRREWAARRFLAGGALGDRRGARGRAVALRNLARNDPAALAAAATPDEVQLLLWEDR